MIEVDPPTVLLERMRIRRGRVMHRVERRASGWLNSLCRQRGHSTLPRAWGPADDWTADRRWYPDCRYCPAELTKQKDGGHDD